MILAVTKQWNTESVMYLVCAHMLLVKYKPHFWLLQNTLTLHTLHFNRHYNKIYDSAAQMRSQKCARGYLLLTVIMFFLEVFDCDYLQTLSENQQSTHLCKDFVSSYWFWTPVTTPSSSHMAIPVVFSNQNTTTHIYRLNRFLQPTARSQLPAARSKQLAAISQQPPATSK